jgi:ribosome-associated translation inhibitor RaiA
MDIPIRIAFHDVPRSDSIEALVYASTQRLASYFDHIHSCRVEIRHADGAETARYTVGIRITVPGSVIEIGGREPSADLSGALSEACDAAHYVRVYGPHGLVRRVGDD